MFMPAASVLAVLGLTVGARTAHADQAQIDQQVKQSLVYVTIAYTGYVNVPAASADNGQAFWSKGIEVDFSCSGVIVDPDGYIATAGHCVDPNNEEVKRAILTQLYLNSGDDQDTAATNAQDAIAQEWAIEGQQAGSPIDRVVRVIQPEGAGRIIDHFVAAQVVDFQKSDDGDNAVIKVANEPPLPALPVAEKAPVPGTALTSVGFPGDVGGAMDPSRLQEPSFKDGTASSQQVTPSGAANTEVSAAISAGMSGGPTVDDATTEVAGLNDYTLTGENQPFNFITDAAALRAFLVKNGVHLVSLAKPAKPFPWIWVAAGAAAGAVLLAVAVVAVVRKRAKRRSGGDGQPPQPVPAAAVAQPSAVPAQSPDPASASPLVERGAVPTTQPQEAPLQPPLVEPSSNGTVELMK